MATLRCSNSNSIEHSKCYNNFESCGNKSLEGGEGMKCIYCDGNLFPVYFGDNVDRLRCQHCNAIFLEKEWTWEYGKLVKRG